MPMEFNATRSNDITVHRSFLTTLCTFTSIGSRSPRYPSIVLQTIAHRFLKGKHARCAKSLAFCRYSYFDCLCTCLYTYVCVCMYITAYEHARVCRLGIAGCCRIAWYYYRRSLHRLASRLSLCRSFLDRSETLFFLVNEPAKKIDRKGNR